MFEKIQSHEIKQVTHRGYDAYMEGLHLSEDNLKNINTVVDVGAGFSNFSKEAHNKFKGLKTIAVDPIYRYLSNDLGETMKQIEKGKFDLDFNDIYDQHKKNSSSNYKEADSRTVYDLIKAKRFKLGNYLAGSNQNIPLKNEIVDLVLANNSMLRDGDNPETVKKSLEECLRILKSNGEIRLRGVRCIDYDSSKNKFSIITLDGIKRDDPRYNEYIMTGKVPDRELEEVFINFKKRGIKFYAVLESGELGGGEEEKYNFDALIVRKDSEIPKIFNHDPLYKLKIEKINL